MAGMLPGVECARRRRFHQGGSTTTESQSGGTRRSSFCLYTSSHDSSINTNSLQRCYTSQSFQTGKLGDIAREAKERLDERLKNQSKSEMKRHKSTGNMGLRDENGGESLGSAAMGSLLREVFGSKKKCNKKLSWVKLGGKELDQEECVVCLEGFKSGEVLVHLPCTHRYHSRCLVPWLETNAHCPYCRTQIPT